MLERFNPDIQKVLKQKTNTISTFSTGSKLLVLSVAESGDVKALGQTISYINLGGDY